MRPGLFLVSWDFLALPRRLDLSAFRNWSTYIEVLDFLTNGFSILDLSFGFVLLLLLCFDVVAVLVAYARAHRAGRFGINLLCFTSRGGLSAA